MKKLGLILSLLLIALPAYAAAPDVRISDNSGDYVVLDLTPSGYITVANSSDTELGILAGGQLSSSGRALMSNQTGVTATVSLMTHLSVAITEVQIIADDFNQGIVYVGGNIVNATSGYPLFTGETVNIKIDDPSEVYLIGTSGDIVHYFAITQ